MSTGFTSRAAVVLELRNIAADIIRVVRAPWTCMQRLKYLREKGLVEWAPFDADQLEALAERMESNS